MDERREHMPPNLIQKLNKRLQEEAFPHFGTGGFSSPHDLNSSGGFPAGTALDLVDDTEDIHPTPKKFNTNILFLQGAGIYSFTSWYFYLFEKMKEHFRLSSNFEEMVDELRHRMEEILA